MGLTIVCGPNGSGKSLWGMYQLERFLLSDRRFIVTSLAVDLERFNEYLQQRHGSDAPDLFRRVVRIGKEEQRAFWRVRGITDAWTDGSDEGEWGRSPEVWGPFGGDDWTGGKEVKGVVYLLDEIQTVFGARDWAKTGPEFVAYQSQHRKMGDDVVVITPASALVEKQFRLLATECVVLVNLYKARIGMWKAPRKIVYRVFNNCPPMPGEDAFATGTIHIDGKALAGCYNTAAGLGVVGSQADKGRESKGFPMWCAWAGLGLIAVLCWVGVKMSVRWAANRNAGLPRVSSVGSASSGAVPVASVSMPGFGVVSDPVAVVGGSQKKAVEVKVEVKPDERVFRCESYGRANGRPFVVVRGQPRFGVGLFEDGEDLELDGRRYRVEPLSGIVKGGLAR